MLSVGIDLKARGVWSTEVSPGELQMFIVNGNGAKAHEAQVKWRSGWYLDGVVHAAWLLVERYFLLTHIIPATLIKAPAHLPPERSWS